MGALASLLQHRHILYSTVVQGLRKRTSANALGMFWLLLYPLLFLGMYSLVFVQIGAALTPWLDVVMRVLGVVVIVMGMSFLGWIPFLQYDKRLHSAPRANLAGAFLLGLTFGVGWAPCIGPTLSAIIVLALPTESPVRGGLLALVYCLGLGLPFIVLALAFRRSAGALKFLRTHRETITRIGGGLLIALGLALVTGLWGRISQELQGWVAQYGTLL